MTALLAFFIVLNSLASEQTGANLYSGTGSFISATDSLGVPGMFATKQSRKSIQLNTASPLYRVPAPSSDHQRGFGPDEEVNELAVKDREREDFERMLNELERFSDQVSGKSISGEVSFDRMKKLPTSAPYLDVPFQKMLVELRPFLSRRHASLELIVWAPTPSAKSWEASALIANQIAQESAAFMQLTPEQTKRLTGTCRQWNSSSMKRPHVTLVIRQSE